MASPLAGAGQPKRRYTGRTVFAAAVSTPFVRRAAAFEPLRVSVFEGNFQEAFDEHGHPDFTRDRGIRIEATGQKSSVARLARVETAARSGEAPADVSIPARGPRPPDREVLVQRATGPFPPSPSGAAHPPNGPGFFNSLNNKIFPVSEASFGRAGREP